MRTLALDIGARRVGVAVSDPLRATARPLTVLAREELEGETGQLAQIVAKEEVDEIVVGLPLMMDGRAGVAAEEARSIAKRLSERLDLPVKTWDERLTTKIAEAAMIQAGARRSTRKEKNDMVAAAVILQSYLDSSSHGVT